MPVAPPWVRVIFWRVHDRASAIRYLWTFAVVALGTGVVGVMLAKPVALARLRILRVRAHHHVARDPLAKS